MAAYWQLSAEPRGVVITVDAAIGGADEVGWHGRLTTIPFGKIIADGDSHSSVRKQLAAGVLDQISGSLMPFPATTVDAVRVMSTSAVRYPRGRNRGGPGIRVPAVADRDGGTWCAATIKAAGRLSGQTAFGDTLGAACAALAETLMLALEVGVEGLSQDWSAVQLLILTRKTYPAGILPAV